MGMPISYKAGVFRNTPCYCLIVLACAGYAQAQTVITNIQDLENISSNLSGSYILENSINASNFNFTPIGSSSSPFTGTFNGNGFAIQNLSIYSSLDSVGLFASNLGTIQNLQLVNPHITASAPVPTLGGIAAINIGTIAQSHVDGGTLIANGVPTSAAPEQIVGGLVGRNSGTISNSHASDAVQVNTSAAGGLAGINSGTITQSYATGSVSGGNNSVLGGLLGSSYTTGLTSVSQSYATGNVVGGSYSKIGGLIGGNISPVVRSFATGNVSGGLGSDVGGLIGFHYGNVSVSQSFATGSVTGTKSSNVGGLVGENFGATIRQSYALGTVTGNGSTHVGGLAGQNGGFGFNSLIDQSYSAGRVSNGGNGQSGGLVGSIYTLDAAPATVTNSYWDTTKSGQPASSGGTPLATSQLKSGTLPAGFNPAAWSTSAGSYPSLSPIVQVSTPRFSIVVGTDEPNNNDGGFTHIYATATPTDGNSLQVEANNSSYIGFDWIQTVTSGPDSYPIGECTNYSNGTCSNAARLSANHQDEPTYGYVIWNNSDCSQFQLDPDPDSSYTRPYTYYYNPVRESDFDSNYCVHPPGASEGSCSIHLISGNSLNFSDHPDDEFNTDGQYFYFKTDLVGILPDGQPSQPLAEFSWKDNYHSTAKPGGGVVVFENGAPVSVRPGTNRVI